MSLWQRVLLAVGVPERTEELDSSDNPGAVHAFVRGRRVRSHSAASAGAGPAW